MNSLVVAGIGVFCLGLGYLIYGRIIKRLWSVDPGNKTPAQTRSDGVDYIPARHWSILFGHHFASIAGAGPIIGPVIAAAIWGWLPALLWIVIGSIFIGAVHDFSSLMLSLRHEGRSIGDVAESVMGRRAKFLICSFLWLALALVIAVFAALAGKTLADRPQVVIPTLGLIPVAVMVGFMLYRWKMNQALATIAGVGGLFFLIYLGYKFPMDIRQMGCIGSLDIGKNAGHIWTVILLIYAYFASVLPVNILLQPRDYLSTFALYFGLFFGFAGLAVTRPAMNTPAFLSSRGSEGFMWPMMFVIVACGAVSGFHSLIATGTTPKQLGSEKHAKRIGYGAMILEGILALLAIICVTAGLYWNKSKGVPDTLVYPILMKQKNWILAFGEGYGQITKPIFGGLGALIAITILKTFIMTTLDSATRIGRYITEEFFRRPSGKNPLGNRYVSTVVIIIPALFLALGRWKNIWPVFGASNQLVAALALLVATVWLWQKGKNYILTGAPAVFMLFTAAGALVYKINEFWHAKKILLSAVGVVLFCLAGFLVVEAWLIIRKKKGTGCLLEKMGKKWRLSLFLICFLFTGCAALSVKKISSAEINIDIESQEIEKARHDFSPGEKLIYKVQWLGLTVAEATIEIQDIVDIEGAKAYKIRLVAETNGIVAKIFPVRNQYISYMDTENIYSVKNETERREGRRVKKEETLFDCINQKAYYRDLLKDRKKAVDIPENTYDVLAAAYYFRTLDVGVGDTVNYNVFSNGKVYPLYATIKKKEYLAVRDIGTFKTFLIEPYIIRNGRIDKRAKVKAYFSADKDRLPVYISLKGPVFTRINIVLQGIEKNV
jgi:carbon starvation protein